MSEASGGGPHEQPVGPVRVQLRRAKGWRMPPNTVKVDRTTEWGNPFIVGKHGDRAYCVQLFRALMQHGLVALSLDNAEAQEDYYIRAAKNLRDLRGKNLACWCRPSDPCHSDVLLELANAEPNAEVSGGRGPSA